MNGFVDKYTQNFPTHNPGGAATPQEHVVLISGTTGAIGSNTLAELYKSSNVARVVVLARNSTTSIFVRQKKALENRGLDPSIIDSSKLILLEGDPALPRFGLEEDVYMELGSTVTHILHIGSWLAVHDIPKPILNSSLGWRVNFNLDLSSFEPNVAGVRNLINFALGSKFSIPPRFIFTSTAAVVARKLVFNRIRRSNDLV